MISDMEIIYETEPSDTDRILLALRKFDVRLSQIEKKVDYLYKKFRTSDENPSPLKKLTITSMEDWNAINNYIILEDEESPSLAKFVSFLQATF